MVKTMITMFKTNFSSSASVKQICPFGGVTLSPLINRLNGEVSERHTSNTSGVDPSPLRSACWKRRLVSKMDTNEQRIPMKKLNKSLKQRITIMQDFAGVKFF